MAMIMLRLKELRDLGFTILILHHTAKSNDRVYKGSTAIFDLCDHNLSLHKVKKGSYAPDEASENDSEDSEDYCYRLGTRDKTRYEPFHIFLEFDIEKGCFVIAPDPDTETLEEIHSLLVGKEPLKTNDIFEIVKKEMGIKGKGKLTRLLKKGIGKYWKDTKDIIDNKTIRYRVLNHQSISPGYIEQDYRTNEKTLVQTNGTNAYTEKLESLVNTDKSVSPDIEKTNRTNEKSLVQTDKTNEETVGTNETGQKDVSEIPESNVIDLSNSELLEVTE